MGLNLSNRQIVQELKLAADDVSAMTTQLRQGIVASQPAMPLAKEVVIRMLANVQQTTIAPLIQATVAPGTQVYTDEYAIYNPLPEWGYAHKTVSGLTHLQP